MAEEIDDSGFYREDFSTDSEWEVFNAQLSEIFQQWELSSSDWGAEFQKNELFQCEWQVQSEKLELLQKEIVIYYYNAKVKPQEIGTSSAESAKSVSPFHKDLMSTLNSFGPLSNEIGKEKLHTLARLFGLRRFVVMHPLKQHLSNPSEFTFFHSTAAVVAAEINSTVPIFVQVFDPKWNFYVGVGLAPYLRTNFDVVALEQSPPDCRYLSGLLSMFKEKQPPLSGKPATISVRNTYALDTLSLRIPMNIPFANYTAVGKENDKATTVELGTSSFTALPSGYFPDSCIEVCLTYTWPEIAENIAIDSALRSDFVPSKAPFRNVHLKVHATSYLSCCVRDYSKLCGSQETLESYVGRNFSGASSGGDMPNPLDQLTKTPHLPNFRTQREQRDYMAAAHKTLQKKLPGPMTDNELEQMLIYLLPYLHPEMALFTYADKSHKTEFDPHRIKSAVADSLVSRLSCLLATCHAHFGSKSGLAQLWAAFTRELRLLWECGSMVPGVAAGFPDTRTCLLHQKLQMLNICMERRSLRETAGGGLPSTPASALIESVSSDELDDDEFYDCDENLQPEDAALKSEGREKRLGTKMLLDVKKPLYVPILQDPVPKTEDQLQDDAEAMLKLGPGSGLTTQMMCSSLLSDMEAFKAANPQCRIEDFIRWYSPNDWLDDALDENGHVVGKLSPRMQSPDNMWQTVWQQAKPVPAWRQKRLFDDTNEALKVLQYLESRTIGEIYELTVVPMLHSAVLKLKDMVNSCQVLDLFEEKIDGLLADICRMSRDIEVVSQSKTGTTIMRTPSPEAIINQLETLETQFYQFKCLEHMTAYPMLIDLTQLKQYFKEMLEHGGTLNIKKHHGDAENDDDPIVSQLLSADMIKNELKEKLISKDYVLRVAGDITSYSKGQSGPQFMRAVVTGDKIRLCGAFTESTTFV